MIDFIPKPTPKDKKLHGYDYYIPPKTDEQIYEEEKAALERDEKELIEGRAALEKAKEIVEQQEKKKRTRSKKEGEGQE